MKMLVVLALLLQDPVAEKVKAHAAKLRAEEIETREDAARALVELGETALPSLQALEAAEADAETKARLKTIVEQIRKAAARAKVYRAPKPVTISAKDRPLRDVVREACDQAGVPFEVSGDADKGVTLEAKDRPLLEVLDRLGTWEMADGRIRVTSAKPSPRSAAYADAFRARVRRVLTSYVNDFDATSATIVVYFNFDAQPGVRPVGTTLTAEVVGVDGQGREQKFKPVMMGQMGGSNSSGSRGNVTVDGISIPWDEETRIEHAAFLKDAPGDLAKLASLKVKTKFRFAGGTKTVSCSWGSGKREEARLGDLPIRVTFSGGSSIHLRHNDFRSRFDDLIDLSTAKIVTKDGKEHDCTVTHTHSGWAFLQCPAAVAGTESELRIGAFDDVFERDVEFEVKDLKLRD